MDSTSIINVITQTINTLFKNLFSSIDNNIYSTLDDITLIGKDILMLDSSSNQKSKIGLNEDQLQIVLASLSSR